MCEEKKIKNSNNKLFEIKIIMKNTKKNKKKKVQKQFRKNG
jgi:hypothetical protein